MAKKATIKAGLFTKTTPTTPAPSKQAAATDEVFDPTDRRRRPEHTKVKAMSVSLTVGEYDEIDSVAASIGATRMAVMNAAIRYTMALQRAGKLKVSTGTKAGRITVAFN